MAKKLTLFNYGGKVVNVVDGDTVDIDVDLGFQVHINMRCRLAGVNAPESNGKTKAAGLAAKAWLTEKLLGKTIQFHSEAYEKYGRALIRVNLDGGDVSEALIKAGHGVAYDGGRRE